MSKLLLNHKINSFISRKEDQMPELKDQTVDELLYSLTADTRNTRY